MKAVDIPLMGFWLSSCSPDSWMLIVFASWSLMRTFGLITCAQTCSYNWLLISKLLRCEMIQEITGGIKDSSACAKACHVCTLSPQYLDLHLDHRFISQRLVHLNPQAPNEMVYFQKTSPKSSRSGLWAPRHVVPVCSHSGPCGLACFAWIARLLYA